MPLAYPDALDLSYHPDYGLLIGRFLRPVSETENEQCYRDLLAAAHAQQQARYWLLDIRRRGRSSLATLSWLQRDFYPQLVRELGAPVRLVYFMAPGLHTEVAADDSIPTPDAYAPGAPFRIQQAITEAEAVRWLLAEQAAEAGS